MRHPAIRQVFDHWNRQRGVQTAPDRDAIDPGAIRSALADTFILALGQNRRPVFRLAGTRLCALFCRELKGDDFLALWDGASGPALDVVLTSVAEDHVGVAGAVMVMAPDAAGDAAAQMEFLLLPLRHRGHVGSRMIGTLAFSGPPPYWCGARPSARLSLGGFRFVGGHIDPRRSALLAAPERPFERILAGPSLRLRSHAAPGGRFAGLRRHDDNGRARRGLIVYDGGRRS